MSRGSDIAIIGGKMKEVKRLRRERHGQPCPICPPNRCATILLPGQRCKVDGFRDVRPSLTDEQEDALWRECCAR
jgi:hypothetical protein